MTTRRDFIGGAGAFAGAVFCGCGLIHAPDAHAQARGEAPRGRGQRPPRQDRRRARALRVPGSHGPDGAEVPAAQSRRRRRPLQGHGRARHRHGGDQHQSVLVRRRPRQGRSRHQAAEREARASSSRRIPTASSPSPPSRCSTRTWRCSSSNTASRRSGSAACRSAAASKAWSSPIRSFIRSGPRPRSSAVSSLSTRPGPRSWRRGSKATADSKTPSAIRSKPRSRCRI